MKKGSPTQPQTASETTAEVLYQKLNGRWYAFSLIDEEVFIAKIAEAQTTPGRTVGEINVPIRPPQATRHSKS